MKIGVTWFVIRMLIVALVPHCPGPGVKVYTEVPMIVVLIVSGLHVPVKPSTDVFGNAGGLEFRHKRPIGLKLGTICDVISISTFVWSPHWPVAGVNVYVVVPINAVLTVDGLHVPVMPSSEVVGSAGAVKPWQ